ncbi:uncharacterized protein V1516DRAFT_608512, partial [Lipomyces oligophaga]|uniref:uncharacterized protein n=1 Tax=Lipomyces oligophaga TaxID=45792 RepID=UPI0034CDEBEC
TAIVVSRTSILLDVTNSRRSSRLVSKQFSMEVPTETISQIDDIIWGLLHRVDGSFAFPPSISTIKSALCRVYPDSTLYFHREGDTSESSADLVGTLTQRLRLQQEKFLDCMYSRHVQEVGGDMDCNTVCFTYHLYSDFISMENIRIASQQLDVQDQKKYDPTYIPDRRYLQYAALWRRIAEDIDLEGPHTAAEWWSVAELRFKVYKARMRNSRIEEIDEFFQRIVEQD